LAMASRMYEVFHVVVEQGWFYRQGAAQVREQWRDLLGERVLMLSDYQRLAEVIVSTLAINQGSDPGKVADSWSGDASTVVANAVQSLGAMPPMYSSR